LQEGIPREQAPPPRWSGLTLAPETAPGVTSISAAMPGLGAQAELQTCGLQKPPSQSAAKLVALFDTPTDWGASSEER